MWLPRFPHHGMFYYSCKESNNFPGRIDPREWATCGFKVYLRGEFVKKGARPEPNGLSGHTCSKTQWVILLVPALETPPQDKNHKTVITQDCPHCIVSKIWNINKCIFHHSVLFEGRWRHFVLESHSQSLNRPYERGPQSKYKECMPYLKFKGNTSLQVQYSLSTHSWICQTFFRSPM